MWWTPVGFCGCPRQTLCMWECVRLPSALRPVPVHPSSTASHWMPSLPRSAWPAGACLTAALPLNTEQGPLLAGDGWFLSSTGVCGHRGPRPLVGPPGARVYVFRTSSWMLKQLRAGVVAACGLLMPHPGLSRSGQSTEGGHSAWDVGARAGSRRSTCPATVWPGGA